ncbi:hypothetical protein [Olsenella uli]|uniref:hypothetical protein n=1 Tax=Olsenella uli TaxID=133926 RepID=UPI003D7B28D7
MTEIQAGLTVATVLVVPYIVQAIKTKAMTGNVARWTAIAASAACGALTAMAGGIPADPSAWVTSIFAAVGGVQVAYAAFKSVGITDKWLDALLALGQLPKEEKMSEEKTLPVDDTGESLSEETLKHLDGCKGEE